jgi:hypothetical protein
MSQLWWYTARSGGIVAWALLAASMIWGLAMSTKASVAGKRPRPNWMLDLHRFLGGAALVFVGIHVAAIMLDTYVDFGFVEVLVPFASSWNPAAVAWGIVASYLLVAVEVTSLLRMKISKRAWRITHMLSFPTFVLTTVHMLTAGTDSSTLGLRMLTAAATVVIGTMTAWRIMQLDRRPDASAAATLAGAPSAAELRRRQLAAARAGLAAPSRPAAGPMAPDVTTPGGSDPEQIDLRPTPAGRLEPAVDPDRHLQPL